MSMSGYARKLGGLRIRKRKCASERVASLGAQRRQRLGMYQFICQIGVHALRNDPIVPQVHAPVQAMPPTKEVAAVTKLKAQAIGKKT